MEQQRKSEQMPNDAITTTTNGNVRHLFGGCTPDYEFVAFE